MGLVTPQALYRCGRFSMAAREYLPQPAECGDPRARGTAVGACHATAAVGVGARHGWHRLASEDRGAGGALPRGLRPGAGARGPAGAGGRGGAGGWAQRCRQSCLRGVPVGVCAPLAAAAGDHARGGGSPSRRHPYPSLPVVKAPGHPPPTRGPGDQPGAHDPGHRAPSDRQAAHPAGQQRPPRRPTAPRQLQRCPGPQPLAPRHQAAQTLRRRPHQPHPLPV